VRRRMLTERRGMRGKSDLGSGMRCVECEEHGCEGFAGIICVKMDSEVRGGRIGEEEMMGRWGGAARDGV
jgi:hypothetical protein